MDPTKNIEWILWGKKARSTWVILLFRFESNWVIIYLYGL